MCYIDWGVVGTWLGSLGTCLTGAVLAFLAYKQNKINKRQSKINQKSQKIEIALRYQSHYTRLSEFIEKFNFDGATYILLLPSRSHVDIELGKALSQKLIWISQLKGESELSFGKDITEIIQNKIIINIICCYTELIKFIKSKKDNINEFGESTNALENNAGAIKEIVDKYKIHSNTKQEILKIYSKYTQILREPEV